MADSAEAADDGLRTARETLRTEQAGNGARYLSTIERRTVTANALYWLRKHKSVTPTSTPDTVTRGPYSFDRDLEEARISRARALIERVDPGAYEDADYLALLAYEAASVEMAFDRMAMVSPDRERFSRFLLGTAHAPEINAFARRVEAGGYTIVVLYSGLVDFVYEAAKAISIALNPHRDDKTPRTVSASGDLDSIRSKVAAQPAISERLYRVLEAYFFNGYPRGSNGEVVPYELEVVLEHMVSMAERWIVGHEYGHGLRPPASSESGATNAAWLEEFRADNNSTVATVYSAGWLDGKPPEFPLASALFALQCLDQLRRSYNILFAGEEEFSTPIAATHPPAADRQQAVLDCFRRYFDVSYGPGRAFDLAFVTRDHVPESHPFVGEYVERATVLAETLEATWPTVRDRLLRDHRDHRPLHPLWT